MKRLFLALPILALAFIACQQTTPNQAKPLAAFEVSFDLESKSARVQQTSLKAQGSLTPTQLSFTAPSSIGFIADTTRNVNYLSATFQVNNSSGNTLQDLTLVAYHKTGNAADTALKNIVDFNNTPLTSTQLEFFARAVQPVNMPSSVSPSFTVNNNVADVQYLNESELTSLETAATTSNELAAGEYLFPYGFVARASNISRSIGTGNNAGTVTIAIKLPNNNEPSSPAPANPYASPRRFSMTFLAFDKPLGTGITRMTESYEERRGTSSAATRAAAVTGFTIPSANIARNTVTDVASSVLVPGVRTAGSKTDLKRMLGERAWQFGTDTYDSGNGTTIDSSGNVYVTGFTYGAFAGNTSAGNADVFIAKYNSSGTELWVKQFGTNQDEEGKGIAVDSSGNVYVTGYTYGAFAGNTSAGVTDVFIAKYNSSGTELWVKQFGTGTFEYGNGIAVDSSDNVYVIGETFGTLAGNTSAGDYDVLIAKYNSSGTELWVKQFGTGTADSGNGIAIDSKGNSYVTGYTNGAFAGNTSAGDYDVLIAKYDSSGTEVWVKQFGTGTADSGKGIALDSSGNAYVTGNTYDAFAGYTNAGIADTFIAKYNSSGTEVWIKQFGTSEDEVGKGIALDSKGNVYVTGNTGGAFAGYTNAGIDDTFIAKYNSSGAEVWVKQFGTSGSDVGNGIALDSSGNVYATGTISSISNVAFAGNTRAASRGNTDAFLLRLDLLTNTYY
jgi:Beta-propeller repeat